MAHPLFSQEWCDAAKEVCNANEDMYQGFKDASTFTHVMALGVAGHPGVGSEVGFKEGRIVSWKPGSIEDSDAWAILNGDIESWRKCADGTASGQQLLMGGKIKLVKGPIGAAIENAKALNSLLLSWGQVDTDWNV